MIKFIAKYINQAHFYLNLKYIQEFNIFILKDINQIYVNLEQVF